MDIGRFTSDATKSKEGVWVAVGGGMELRIARLGNPAYTSYMRKIGKPLAHQIRHGTVDTPEMETALRDAMSHHILLEWKGMERDGQTVPYSQPEAFKILNDPRYRDFYELVLELSQDRELFKVALDENARKNSLPASNGS